LKIVFITDGNKELGLGHIYQSTTLAREFIGKNNILFLTQSEYSVMKQIEEAGFGVLQMDDVKKLIFLQNCKPDIIIIDKLDVSEKFAKVIKETLTAKLVIMTNLTSANQYADMAVCAMTNGKLCNAKFTDGSTKYYSGAKYFILRKEFYEYHDKGKKLNGICKILLVFGGVDKANLTIPVLEELLKGNYKIDVIKSAMYANPELLDKFKDKVAIHTNTNEVARLMYEADLCIVSPGLSLFEALCVGTPIVAIPQLPYQWDACVGQIKMIHREEIGKLNDIIRKKDFSFPQDKNIKEMEIGQGKAELVAEILK
jgi:spore coat polysaccharide biosynthesis predicted glycosyltransferase SpsG